MTRYAYFDNELPEGPRPVIGWIDTEAVAYPSLPAAENLVELTDEQWDARLNGRWVIVPGVGNGVLTQADDTPPPTPEPTIDDVLAAKIADGIAITSFGDPEALSCTMALDAVTMEQIGSVARDAASGMGLPAGSPVFVYPDINGQPRVFTEARIIALYRAQRDLLYGLNTQAAIDRHGGTAAWPEQIGTIP